MVPLIGTPFRVLLRIAPVVPSVMRSSHHVNVCQQLRTKKTDY